MTRRSDYVTPDGRPAGEEPRWRADLPIDTDRDAYVSRRDFIKFLVLTSGAFVFGQLWVGFLSLRRRLRGEAPEMVIARRDDVPIGGALGFHYPDARTSCLLLRTAEDTYIAYGNQCTHLMCAVRPQVDEGLLHCPCHAGYFDLGTGRPVAGPPRRPLPRVHLRIDGDRIVATGMEHRTT